MNIALAIDELSKLTEQPPAAASAKRSWGFAYWILLAGILSGLGSLVLAAIANAKP